MQFVQADIILTKPYLLKYWMHEKYTSFSKLQGPTHVHFLNPSSITTFFCQRQRSVFTLSVTAKKMSGSCVTT